MPKNPTTTQGAPTKATHDLARKTKGKEPLVDYN
jgi:hypothetical protein